MERHIYKKVNIPKDLTDRAEKLLPKIGCPKLSAFVSMAITEYLNQQEKRFE